MQKEKCKSKTHKKYQGNMASQKNYLFLAVTLKAQNIANYLIELKIDVNQQVTRKLKTIQ